MVITKCVRKSFVELLIENPMQHIFREANIFFLILKIMRHADDSDIGT